MSQSTSNCCCCCSIFNAYIQYLSSCRRTAADAKYWTICTLFIAMTTSWLEESCLGVSNDPMLQWISSNSCPLNVLLVRSHRAEMNIVKRLIQRRNYVIRVRVKLKSIHIITESYFRIA